MSLIESTEENQQLLKHKVGICGVHGEGPEFSGGQPVKVQTLIHMFRERYGPESVEIANTYNWKAGLSLIFFKCLRIARSCDAVIILPAQGGIKVLVPLFLMFRNIFGCKVYYSVIGGWLPEMLRLKPILRKLLTELDGIWVETQHIYDSLRELGFINIEVIANTKSINAIKRDQVPSKTSKPLRLCTFGRILPEKGIEDAVNVVIRINKGNDIPLSTLDIYGPIAEDYIVHFTRLISDLPSFINYCGCINPCDSVNTLKHYDIQLFPTRFRTEGVPGSIIDSYASALPVLASRWDSFNETVLEAITGWGYRFGDVDDFYIQLLRLIKNPEELPNIKVNCLNFYHQTYLPHIILQKIEKAMRWV